MSLTLLEYALATPDDLGGHTQYRDFCRIAHLTPISNGYGLLLCQDDNGLRWTLFTSDVEYVRVLAAADVAVLRGLEIPQSKFPGRRQGWPDEWN